MPFTEITQTLTDLELNTPSNQQLIHGYVENIDELEQEISFKALNLILNFVQKPPYKVENTLPILLTLRPSALHYLSKMIEFFRLAKKGVNIELLSVIVECLQSNSTETYNVTANLAVIFDIIPFYNLKKLYTPQHITNISTLLVSYNDLNIVQKTAIVNHSYLASDKYSELLEPILDIIGKINQDLVVSVMESTYILAQNNALSINAIDAVFKHSYRTRIRVEIYCLCHKNHLVQVGNVLAARKNINYYHLEILKLLEKQNLLNAKVLASWHNLNPSNEYAGKQYFVLQKIAQAEILDELLVARILTINLKQFKDITLNEWSNMLNIFTGDIGITWPNKTLFTLHPKENYYLSDLLYLNTLLTIFRQYDVTINRVLTNIFDFHGSANSLFKNRNTIITLAKLFKILHNNSLLSKSIIKDIALKQSLIYGNSYTDYLDEIFVTLSIPKVISRLNIEHVASIFNLGDLLSIPLSETLTPFVPELFGKNNSIKLAIDYLENEIFENIQHTLIVSNKLRILSPLVILYEFLQETDNYSDKLWIQIVRVGLFSTTRISSDLSYLIKILKLIYKNNSKQRASIYLQRLLSSENINFLITLDSRLVTLEKNPQALNKLYSSTYFIDALISKIDVASYLDILEVLVTQRRLLNDKYLNILKTLDITEELKKILLLIKNSYSLNVDTFEFAINYSMLFVNEDGTIIAELNHIQPGQIYIDNWNDLIAICKSNKTKYERKFAIKSYLGNKVLAYDPSFNVPQSTHTASVHLSTDMTFWLLNTKYSGINFATLEEQLLQEIAEYAQSTRFKIELGEEKWHIQKGIDSINVLFRTLSMSSIEVSAERKAEVFAFMEKMNLLIENSAIQHLANNLRDDLSSDSYESIPRFLLLLYREIMHNRPDDDNQYVALEAFLKACYESVRGYNLDARGVDRNKQLRNYEICAGGIANKFCEILIDQSDLILFYFVGAETISRKLQAELFQHTRSVYNTLRISDPISARRDFTSLSDNAEAADIIAKIWDEKRSSIRDCVHAEFYGFITPANLDKEIDKFENAALPYIPSPCHFTARRFYSADFVEWFRSTNISLSVARQGVRSFGEFSEGNNLTPSTIDSVPEPQNKRIRNG